MWLADKGLIDFISQSLVWHLNYRWLTQFETLTQFVSLELEGAKLPLYKVSV